MFQRIKHKYTELRNDPHMREVGRGTILAFILKIIGSGLAFGFNVAVARLLGAEGAGLYFIALSVTAIGSVIGRVGLDNALLRFVAAHATNEEWDKVKGVYALGMRIAIAAAGSVTVIAFFAAPWMAIEIFNKPEIAEPLRWMSLSILPFALLNLQAESLKGLKRIRDAMVVQSIGLPLISLMLVVPLASATGVLGVSLAYLLGAVAVCALGIWAWRRAIAEHTISTATFSFSDLWASCRPLYVVSLLNNAVRNWAPILLLGVWATNDEVGIYGAALRLVSLISIMLFTLNNVLAPKIAELYTKGDMHILAATARRSALILILLASPLFLLLIFGSTWVMAIYGPDFKEGGMVLAILTAGQIVNVFAGSLGAILIVSGNERYVQNMALIFTVIMLVMLLILIPAMGMIGAAISVSVAGTGLSIVTVWQANRIVGMPIIPLFSAPNISK